MSDTTAYCFACEKQIHVTLTPAPTHEGHANLMDGAMVCLDFGEACCGGSCPLIGMPGIVMGVRLARSGLEHQWSTIQGPCQGCGDVRELEILDDSHAYCAVCGSTSRWTRIDLGDDSYAALAGTG